MTARSILRRTPISMRFPIVPKVTDIFEPKGLDGTPSGNIVVIGQVMGIHIDEAALVDGMLDMSIAAPLGRLGYMDYADASQAFQMRRAPWTKG